jgi:hypothetical protein
VCFRLNASRRSSDPDPPAFAMQKVQERRLEELQQSGLRKPGRVRELRHEPPGHGC